MNFEALYRWAVMQASDGDLFLEIGTYKGRSAAYMMHRILQSGKDIGFITVDPFDGSGDKYSKYPREIYQDFSQGIKALGIKVVHLVGRSQDLAPYLADGSLAFVFVDGSHDYQDVKADLEAYLPKVKPGGILAGHDLQYQDVKRAVKPYKYEVWKNCYLIKSGG